MICGQCQRDPPAFSSVQALYKYAAPIDRLIVAAKYAGRLDWVALLGRLLARHVKKRASLVDAIVPVPLHKSRLRERGYNQSLELARPLAKQLNVKLLRGVDRVRATDAQASLSRKERKKNVRHAFVTKDNVKGLRIALIDDVMTSGATADSAARCLLKAGARSVEVWVVARA